MSIVTVGCSHTSAPLDLLERVSAPPGEIPALLASLRASVREGFILSTCNRTEIYAVTGHAASGIDRIFQWLSDTCGLSTAELRSASYAHVYDDAARHLLRVASGLDSLVLGEDQIQAQLKRALAAARSAGTLGPVLERLGDAALACGKRVRTFTNVGRHAVSLESLAVKAVTERIGELASRRVLVLGSGESARLIVRQLRAVDTKLTILGRRPERARELAAESGAKWGALEELSQRLQSADVVFCCTSAPQPVLSRETLPSRPLVCVDLGMPRDVEPAVALLDNVQLITLAELAGLAESHRAARRRDIPAAEEIVRAESQRFLEWHRARASAMTIAALHEHAQRIADAELARSLNRLEHASPHDRAVMSELVHRIVAKLLHRPSETLRTHPEAENLALALGAIFGLPGAQHALNEAIPSQSSPTTGAPALPDDIEDAAS